ncbi:transmembrane channel-like protein 7 [Nerophis lumbriciformis]|uniref:transmembrane channel-like protein 7 n=1 Tax=Nerophis lumbriciformis TaxID=546530 RepID=UPI003BABA4B3
MTGLLVTCFCPGEEFAGLASPDGEPKPSLMASVFADASGTAVWRCPRAKGSGWAPANHQGSTPSLRVPRGNSGASPPPSLSTPSTYLRPPPRSSLRKKWLLASFCHVVVASYCGVVLSGCRRTTPDESVKVKRVSMDQHTKQYQEGSADVSDGGQRSLWLRHASCEQNYPECSWGAADEEEDEDGGCHDLRTLPLPLALKRSVSKVHQRQVPVVSSRMSSWRQKKQKSLTKVKKNGKELLSCLVLWKKSLQQIGGNFGGGVQSYFLLLRFLVVLNFLSCLLIAAFVLGPSIVFRSQGSSPANHTGPEECLKYDPRPQGLVLFYNYLLDLLSGTGFVEYSYVFYGYYGNAMAGDGEFSYNVPLAFILTAVFYFAFCLVCIIARTGTAARVAVATGGNAAGDYSMVVFTGWDYGCLGDRATKLKQKNIHYRLQVDLEEEMMKKRVASLTANQKCLLYSLRILMSLVAMALIMAACYGIFVTTVFSQGRSGDQGMLAVIVEYLPSMVITAANFLVPLACDQLALAERYAASTSVILALLRAVLLRLVSLGVLLFTLWRQITCQVDRSRCHLCQYDHQEYPCWESRVGQEMYKLTLFELMVTVAVLVLVESPRRMLADNCSNKLARWLGRQEFVVSANVLSLVYGQTVVWTGALFCPLLPLINTLKLVMVFYCKKITLFYNCRPALKTFRSTTSTFVFLVVLLVGWAMASLVLIYSVSQIRPSMACGPFRSFTSMWAIVPTVFYRLSDVTKEFLFFVGSQAFSIPLFALSCVAMCYFIALSAVYGRSVTLLRAQLKQEGRDKQFLVQQIEKVSGLLHTPTL